MKICIKCGANKPEDRFYKRKNSKDGLRSECKDCRSKSDNRRYLSRRDIVLKQSKQRHIINKDKISKQHKQRHLARRSEILEKKNNGTYPIKVKQQSIVSNGI